MIPNTYYDTYYSKDYKIDVARLSRKTDDPENLVQNSILSLLQTQPEVKDYNHFLSTLRRKQAQLHIDELRAKHQTVSLDDEDCPYDPEAPEQDTIINDLITNNNRLMPIEKQLITYCYNNDIKMSNMPLLTKEFHITEYQLKLFRKHIKEVLKNEI